MILEVDNSDKGKSLFILVSFLKDTNQWNNTDSAKMLELIITQYLNGPKLS